MSKCRHHPTPEQEAALQREIGTIPPPRTPGREGLILALAERLGVSRALMYSRLRRIWKPCPQEPGDSTSAIFPGSEITPEQVEFGRAMLVAQHRLGRRNLTYRDILRVARSLGYRRASPAA